MNANDFFQDCINQLNDPTNFTKNTMDEHIDENQEYFKINVLIRIFIQIISLGEMCEWFHCKLFENKHICYSDHLGFILRLSLFSYT